MNKRPEVTEITKHNLRYAFWKLYTQKPIEKISVKEITNLAGYNRGTFYLYYKDTYDILFQIESQLLKDIDTLITSWLSQDDFSDLINHMEGLVSMAQKYSSYITVLLSDQGDPVFVTKLKELIRPLISHWILKDEIYSDQEKELLSQFYLSGLLSMISQWLSSPQNMDINQFVAFTFQHILPK